MAHQLQQQKNIKAKQMGSDKWPQEGTRKSPRLNKLGKCNDTHVTCKPTTVKRKLSLQSGPHENETMGENEVEVRCVQFYPFLFNFIVPVQFYLSYIIVSHLYMQSERTIPPPPPLTEYEK